MNAKQSVSRDTTEADEGRRDWFAALLGLGAVAVAGCAGSASSPADEPALGTASQAITTTEIPIAVATRTDMKNLDVAVHTICYLAEAGREGVWLWMLGDYSSPVTTDTDNGVFLASSSTPANQGAWVRVVPDGLWNTSWFGVPTDNASDASPTLGRMLTLFNSDKVNAIGIRWGGCIYNLMTAALPVATKAISHFGARGGPQTTIINKQYNEATNRGIIAFENFGGLVSGITLKATAGSGGSGLSSILTQSSPAAGRLMLERVYVSGGSNLDYSVYLDGTANTNLDGPGNRGIQMTACEIFGAKIASVHAKLVHHLLMAPVFIATSGGPITSAALHIEGTVTPNLNLIASDDVQIKGIVAGRIELDNLTRSLINTPIDADVTNTATVRSTVIQGPYRSGTLSHAWVDDSHYEIGRRYLDRAEVYMDGTSAAQTGDGAFMLVKFNGNPSTSLDLGVPSAYTSTGANAGRYTATRAGYHSVALQLCVTCPNGGLGSYGRMTLLIQQYASNGSTIVEGYRSTAANAATTVFQSNYAVIQLNTEIYMDPGQYLQVWLSVGGGPANSVAVFGEAGGGSRYSRMEARLT